MRNWLQLWRDSLSSADGVIMNVFDLRNKLIRDYALFVGSFVKIRDSQIRQFVEEQFTSGALWPQQLVQLNPSFERAESIDELLGLGLLHEGCSQVFRWKKGSIDRGVK